MPLLPYTLLLLTTPHQVGKSNQEEWDWRGM